MVNLTKAVGEAVLCENKDKPIEYRTGPNGEAIPKDIMTQESFEAACYLCKGHKDGCPFYRDKQEA
jgi:hypothetical protein